MKQRIFNISYWKSFHPVWHRIMTYCKSKEGNQWFEITILKLTARLLLKNHIHRNFQSNHPSIILKWPNRNNLFMSERIFRFSRWTTSMLVTDPSRMLGTNCVGDNFEMLVTVLTIFVFNILYLLTLVLWTNIQKM